MDQDEVDRLNEHMARAINGAVERGRRGRDNGYCDANARKGTGTGACDRPLDDHGLCDRAGSHL